MSATYGCPPREYIAFLYCPISNEYIYTSTYPDIEYSFQLLDSHPQKWLVIYKKTDISGRYQLVLKSRGTSTISYVECQPMNYVSLIRPSLETEHQWFFHSKLDFISH